MAQAPTQSFLSVYGVKRNEIQDWRFLDESQPLKLVSYLIGPDSPGQKQTLDASALEKLLSGEEPIFNKIQSPRKQERINRRQQAAKKGSVKSTELSRQTTTSTESSGAGLDPGLTSNQASEVDDKPSRPRRTCCFKQLRVFDIKVEAKRTPEYEMVKTMTNNSSNFTTEKNQRGQYPAIDRNEGLPSAFSIPTNVISVPKNLFFRLLDTYEVSNVFLSHVFGFGSAVGWHADPKKPRCFHLWYSLMLGKGKSPVELYQVLDFTSEMSTVFVLRIPDKVIKAIKDSNESKNILAEPCKLHVLILEAAVGSWNLKYHEMLNKLEMKETESFREGSLLNAHDIRSLHDDSYQWKRYLEMIGQLRMNMHKLQQILMQMHGAESDTSISFASTNEHWVMEISYLEQQIVFLEMLYAAGVQRIETLVQLNYHLASDNLGKSAEQLGEAMKRDSGTMRTLTTVVAVSLPTTIISTIFGSNFVAFDLSTQNVQISKWIWVLFLLSFLLTLLTFCAWRLWEAQERSFRLKALLKFRSKKLDSTCNV